jgi:hypothetical protein
MHGMGNSAGIIVFDLNDSQGFLANVDPTTIAENDIVCGICREPMNHNINRSSYHVVISSGMIALLGGSRDKNQQPKILLEPRDRIDVLTARKNTNWNESLRGMVQPWGRVSRSAGCFGCYVTCPNAVSSRVIHLVFHRHQHNCSSSLDSIKLVYQHPLERPSAATNSYEPGS